LLQVKDLVLFYENAVAVNNVNMEVHERQIVGVFGSNSAGKSSLMYCISGIILDVKKKEEMKGGERITLGGEILFQEKNVLWVEPSQRARNGIVLCPERRLIFPESSTLENLRMGGYLATREQAKKTLQYVFNLFPELERLKRRQGGFLSGGEQQMLAIGRALMAQPKLLLLDEPLLGLAPIIEVRLAKAVRDINRETGITVLVSEQYARPVIPIIEYGYVLENGGLVAQGSGKELLENPDVKEAYFGL
jgi:branched-chain amino acid transport system ATP-binding protein